MKTKVTLDDQPLDFIRRQPPEAKRALREALHQVEAGKSIPAPLGDELEGFGKVKVGDYRLVLQSLPGGYGPAFRVVFAERRKYVYVLFSQIIGLD
jgi:mRNA-degrading endonuclease RelE of RelBE toxin-antitoxin system